MSNTNNGGPAFPTTDPNYEAKYAGEGMSLRDYFAAKAMEGLLAQSRGSALLSDLAAGAVYAYRMADAMLEVRGDA